MATVQEARDSLTNLLTVIEAKDAAVAANIATQVATNTAQAKADYEAELQVLKDAMDAEAAKVVASTPVVAPQVV